MKSVNIVIDVGSSGIRALAFTLSGELVASVKKEYETFYPETGWAEQSPLAWEASTVFSLRGIVKKLSGQYKISGLSLTGQCPTYIPVDKNMRPLENALTYQDNRSSREAEYLIEKFGDKYIHEHSGHSIQPFFILPKLLWHKNNNPALFEKIYKVLQPCDYIEYFLTGSLSTDYTYVYGTLAFDISTNNWNRPLLKELGLKEDIFPDTILNSWDIAGELRDDIAKKTGLQKGLKVVRGGPDSQCCSLGVSAIESDVLSNMSGTSTCLNGTVSTPVNDLRVGNYAHVIPDRWSTEVGLNTTGASLIKISAMLFSNLNEKERYAKIKECIAKSAAGSSGLLFLPYLSNGERDNKDIKGSFYNLNMFTTQEDMIRSVMEGVAFAEKERARLLSQAGQVFSSMRISGGGASSQEWCQIKADVMNIPVYALRDVDAAELGAAMIAAVGVGDFPDFASAISECRLSYDEYLPDSQNALVYKELYEKFIDLENKLSRN